MKATNHHTKRAVVLSLALLAISVWLARRAKAAWFALLPMIFMFAVTMTSLVGLARANLDANLLAAVISILLFVVAYLLALQAGLTLYSVYRRK